MKDIINVCAYCERNADEVVAETATSRLLPVSLEEALQFVRVGNNRVLLCPDDRADRTPLTEAEMWELINAPVDLPPGVTALAHHCPMLEYDGFPEKEATYTVELEEDDEQPGFLVGRCPECGMSVRSPVLGDRAAEEHPAEGGEE